MHKGAIYALMSALLFGASTPFSKLLVGQVAPVMLAGLLYLGSGVGLLIFYLLRAAISRADQATPAGMAASDLPWFAGAIVAGGIAGPVLLMLGLTRTPASSAALLLNLEGVLTALLAWCVFKENFDRRILIGMLFIVGAGVLLSWEQMPASGLPWGAIAIAGACLCWAIDNNLTRKVSGGDAVQIAGIKGLIAGSVNLSIALVMGLSMPVWETSLMAGVIGFFGYGLSLVLFVVALRHLGTARTGAYFSSAPFAGAVIAVVVLGDLPSLIFWIALALMCVGIWLHLTERHGHVHHHAPMAHDHAHTHDAHHQHDHDFPWEANKAHSHFHQHATLQHQHAHVPDIHHRHRH